MRAMLSLVMSLACGVCAAAPAYGVWDEFKYKPGFTHFEYVNPNAPKGGELRLISASRVSNFDKYNPFTLKGREPTFLADLLFESLLTGSMDEVGVAYGLLAEDVQVAPDRRSATFRINPAARFHNGDPVRASDVKHSYETLISKYAAPGFATLYADVAGCDVVDERTVRFRFKVPDRQLPLVVGGIPVFSAKWGAGKTFDNVITDIPIATGPYRLGPMELGKDVTYVRDPGYWAKDLAVRRGMANFDRITIRIYRDNTAQLEALKAGEFDLMEFYSAGDWTRRLNGKRIESGEVIKSPFRHRRPDGFQSYLFNTRLDKFKDRRVRMAIELAMDYEWMNRMLFRGSYTRVKGLFGNTDCEANGLPSPAEVALMAPYRAELHPDTFGPMAVPPNTDPPGSLRENLRKARALLEQAGWKLKDGQLRNAKGEPLTIEYLETSEGKGASLTAGWRRSLEKLGIEMVVRDVDFALYQERLDNFQFEMISINFPGTHFPGAEYGQIFGSKAADTVGSSNWVGVKSPAIDALIAKVTGANSRDEFLAACRALDRVVAHGHYMVPAWTNRENRVAYNHWRLERPAMVPPYPPEGIAYMDWPIFTWWTRNPPRTH
ncbi:extracellular solute-binding protein [Ramlibacter albus]|uniref:ABC transporter substrate-binding protein n=1 Tax=Ramlibacter albus TaxID=2079448 RepID=A0A923M6P8_9BURK|nr:extracellular solute-binding protein [Ramlibacter albus]MBC5764350.1 ABC transporter substrate-binding protein [Ramlibacter albus]